MATTLAGARRADAAPTSAEAATPAAVGEQKSVRLIFGALLLVLLLASLVLVLAVQNAVDYRQLGVATSGSILFRQIGGSIDVASFGTIFANQLAGDLNSRLPAGMRVPAAADPAALRRLPPPLHTAYVSAITNALHPVFLAAAGAAALAFVLSWFLRELPLRATAHGPSGESN